MNTQQNSNINPVSPFPNNTENGTHTQNTEANKKLIVEDEITLPWWQHICIGFVCMIFCCPCYSVYLCALCCCKDKFEVEVIEDGVKKRRRSSIIDVIPFINHDRRRSTLISNNMHIIPIEKNIYSNAPPRINYEYQPTIHLREGTDVLNHIHENNNFAYVNTETRKEQQKILTFIEQENNKKTTNDDLLAINKKESYKSKRSKSKAVSRQKSINEEVRSNNMNKNVDTGESKNSNFNNDEI
jgi:hypothetical protein